MKIKTTIIAMMRKKRMRIKMKMIVRMKTKMRIMRTMMMMTPAKRIKYLSSISHHASRPSLPDEIFYPGPNGPGYPPDS
jgi:hypothetical protein